MTDRLDYVLIDLDRVREAGLIEQAVADPDAEIPNRDGRTSFIAITLAGLANAGAVLGIDLELPPRLAMRTPPWYEQKCEAISRARWRNQMTQEEEKVELDFWHGVAMRLPFPEGWATGRIRSIEALPEEDL